MEKRQGRGRGRGRGGVSVPTPPSASRAAGTRGRVQQQQQQQEQEQEQEQARRRKRRVQEEEVQEEEEEEKVTAVQAGQDSDSESRPWLDWGAMRPSIASSSVTRELLLDRCPGAKVEQLQELSLRFAGLSSLEGLEQCPLLVKLDLSYNALTSLEHLQGCSAKLRLLDLSANRLTSLRGVPSLPQLRNLNLADNALSSIGGDLLQPMDSLSVLSLRNNKLGPDGTAMLRWCSASLTELDLSNNQLADAEGMVRFPGPMPALRKLDISFNGVRKVLGLHRLGGVVELHVDHNKLSGPSISEALPRLGALRSLAVLNLSSNHISGVAHPGEKLSSLSELDLSGNAVSGPLELVLQTLLGTLPALEVLDISGNDVSLHEEAEADASGGTQQEKSSLLLLKDRWLLDALRSSFAGGLGSSLRELSLLGNPCCLGLTEDSLRELVTRAAPQLDTLDGKELRVVSSLAFVDEIERQGLYTPPPEEAEAELETQVVPGRGKSAPPGPSSSGGSLHSHQPSRLEAQLEESLRSLEGPGSGRGASGLAPGGGARTGTGIEEEIRKMHQEMDELRTKYVGLFDEMSTELKDPFKKSRSAYVIASSSSSRVADPTAKSQRPSSSSTGSRAFARLDEARTVSQVLYADEDAGAEEDGGKEGDTVWGGGGKSKTPVPPPRPLSASGPPLRGEELPGDGARRGSAGGGRGDSSTTATSGIPEEDSPSPVEFSFEKVPQLPGYSARDRPWSKVEQENVTGREAERKGPPPVAVAPSAGRALKLTLTAGGGASAPKKPVGYTGFRAPSKAARPPKQAGASSSSSAASSTTGRPPS